MFKDFDFVKYFDENGKLVLHLTVANIYYEVLVNFDNDLKNDTNYFCNLSDIPQLIKLMLFTEPSFRGTQEMNANILKCGKGNQTIKTVQFSLVEVLPKKDFEYYPLFPELEKIEKLKYVKRNETKTLRYDSF